MPPPSRPLSTSIVKTPSSHGFFSFNTEHNVIGVSLSEPHTDQLYGNLSVAVVCPFGPRGKVLAQYFGHRGLQHMQ